jgi:hypothetical protein
MEQFLSVKIFQKNLPENMGKRTTWLLPPYNAKSQCASHHPSCTERTLLRFYLFAVPVIQWEGSFERSTQQNNTSETEDSERHYKRKNGVLLFAPLRYTLSLKNARTFFVF